MISTKLTKIGEKMGEFEEFFATIPNPSTGQDIRKKLIEMLYPQCHKNQSKKPDPLEFSTEAGRQASYKDTVLYSTLMPCYLCTGAVIQFGIPKVIVGESVTFPGGECKWGKSGEFMLANNIELRTF